MDIFVEFIKSIPFGGWVCIVLGVCIAIMDDGKVFSLAYNIVVWGIIIICGVAVLMVILYQILGYSLILVALVAAMLLGRISPSSRKTLLPVTLFVLGLGVYLVFFTS